MFWSAYRWRLLFDLRPDVCVRSTLDAKLNLAVVLGEARRTQEAEGVGNDVIEQLLTVHELKIGDPEVLRVRGHIIGHARNNM